MDSNFIIENNIIINEQENINQVLNSSNLFINNIVSNLENILNNANTPVIGYHAISINMNMDNIVEFDDDLNPRVYACSTCLQKFNDRNKYFLHFNECNKVNNLQIEECPICLENIEDNNNYHCNQCKQLIGCNSCIKTMLYKKNINNNIFLDKNLNVSLDCPFCRVKCIFNLELNSISNNNNFDINNIKLLLTSYKHKQRKTVYIDEVLKFIEKC